MLHLFMNKSNLASKPTPVGKDHYGRIIYSITFPHGIEYGVYIGDIFWLYWDLSPEPYLG